ncbi:MAG TPA: glycosyltransferase family 39 protein [Candidatus Saccharimonadales bacterium]|nr:glycosyltransferase family 39 protein [Candidatus Saccharimonadales bacterium]
MRETQKTGSGHLDAPVAARWVGVTLGVLIVFLLFLAVLLLPLHFVPYGKAKMLFDWYAPRHGAYSNTRNVLSAAAYGHFVDRLPVAAAVFGICGMVLALCKQVLGRFLLELPADWKAFSSYFGRQFDKGSETILEIASVAIVFGIGVFLRWHHLGRPVCFDEAWTYVDFAARPLGLVLSRYPAPNNHLLNTLLIHFSTAWFGNTVLGLRFPALVAGCLVIPATWFLGRALYGSAAGILAAGAVAGLPTFVEFSVNGRGYSLQWLRTLWSATP